ncbi:MULTISPECIES: DUF2808 domain-containing protein [unclassified Synechococcus]|uniref:DUF2808 domain-containing protein n=1 Tax=unclassified Synechococcus TaxID=2626047 RepID=UPI0020014443|nr:DUF2808 domain-containing protein [Synechococcus sp. A10-1-5-1]UPM51104.1 DUF2808 domain-containing protein [Synechococcus sp. A10-1-5-1]
MINRNRVSFKRTAFKLAALAGCGAALTGAQLGLAPQKALAQGTPSIMEFRWDNTKDYRKLYYFTTNTVRQQRAEYYFLLKPKDRKTAILKLAISVPQTFDTTLDPQKIKLCYMKSGSMTKRTRCEETIPATVEVTADGRSIEIFPDTPVPVGKTIGVYMQVINPRSAGMFQFNALAQAPGAVPISGYLGSWLIQVDATSDF